MSERVVTGISIKKENRIKRIATTTSSFLPMLPFVFFCWMSVFYYRSYAYWPMPGGLFGTYLEVIYIVFIFLIRISLIANSLMMIWRFITSRGMKGIPFSTAFLRTTLLALCVIATILAFTELYLCTFLFRSLYLTDPFFGILFVTPSITDPRVLFGLLLLIIAILGCLEKYRENKAEITTKIKSIPKSLFNIVYKKGNRGGALLKTVSFIYFIIGICFLSWGLISLVARVALMYSLEPCFFASFSFSLHWYHVRFSRAIFTILIGGATLFAGIVGFQRKSRRIVFIAWMIYFLIAVVSIPHRSPSVHEFYSSVILLALYLLGWLDHRWQPLVGRWAGIGDVQLEYSFYYDGTGSRITNNGVEGFEWLTKSDEGEILHLTLDCVIESEGQEAWGFNIEEDVLVLENVADRMTNGTRVEFVRMK